MAEPAVPGTVRVRLDEVELAYGETLALACDSLDVSGTIIALVGHNGSGKSTFIKAVLGLHSPRWGKIRVQGTWGALGPQELTPERDMAFSPENGAVFEDISVESYVRLWCRLKQRSSAYYRREGSRFIELFQIEELLKKKGRELSKGQRRRVQMVVGYLSAPRLFLFDEPFDGLDVLQTKHLSDIILQESHRTSVILSSHRMEVVERIADTVIVLQDGEVFASGKVEAVCRAMCPANYLFRPAEPEHLLELLSIAQDCYPTARVVQYQQQVAVSGISLDPARLTAALQNCGLEVAEVSEERANLPDAMSFHLSRFSQNACRLPGQSATNATPNR